VDRSEIRQLKALGPSLGIIKSLIVKPGPVDELIREAMEYEAFVDAWITDTFDPATGRSGATGKTHDWAVSRSIVESTQKPVILAGGLTPANVGEAITQVRPAAVDVHSGVEARNGRKDRQRLTCFVRRALAAFSRLDRGTQDVGQNQPSN
jgi:phosphoribosylanthranilate isomerase